VINKKELIMKVRNYLDTKPIHELPGVIKREVITADDGAPNFCMRVFEVEPGSSIPLHSHPWEHEIFVLSGQGAALSEGGETQVVAENVIFVPPNERHGFANNGNEILRFICVIPLTKS
jgi:quercetin dioxygenase-like cupin family protein